MKRYLWLILLTVALPVSVVAQEPAHISIHQMQSQNPEQRITVEPGFGFEKSVQSSSALNKRVFGYYPYWSSSSMYTNIDYTALTAIGYFSYEVDTATGSYSTLHTWLTTPAIAYAHARGVKVMLVVTNFNAAENTAVLSSADKRRTLADSIVAVVRRANGDGVNIDFEAVSSSQKQNMVLFMDELTQKMHAAIPNSEVSMATPAVDWSNAWDLVALSQICDYLIVMGYDYYWSASPNAGPVAPLTGGTYNVTNSVNTYLSKGVSPSKLLLGVPWYGYDWPVKDSVRKSTTTGTATAVVYGTVVGRGKTYGAVFDSEHQVPWYKYTAGTVLRQTWYDDSISLGKKYNLVNSKNLGGIGIWALGYDGGRADAWQGIKAAFTTSGITNTSEADIAFSITPNVMNKYGTVRFQLARTSEFELTIRDVLGRTMRVVESGKLEQGSYSTEIGTEDLPSGMYYLVIKSRGATMSQPFLVQH